MALKLTLRETANRLCLFVVVSMLAACTPLPAAETPRAPTAPNVWYVDNSANGGNSGTSWSDAWEAFEDIDWGTGGVVAGDTLYISGGSSSKGYYETLTVGVSGSAGFPIRIDVGANSPSPSGHSGTVVIDGGLTRSSGIVILGRDYISVNGLDAQENYKLLVQNHTGIGVGSVQVRNSSYTNIDYVQVNNGRSRGVFFDNADHSRIRGCDIRTGFVNYAAQTDSIYLQFGNDNIIESNVVVLSNADASNHMDCLQVANGENRLTIRNNWLEWTNGLGNDQSQTFIIEGSSDWVRFYNNVVLGSSDNPYQAALFKDSSGGVHSIWNNIIIAQHPTGIALKSNSMTDAEFGEIKNNIFYSPNGYPVFLNTSVAASKMDYNLLYRSTGSAVSYMGGTIRTWAQHQAAGYDLHGINADPDYDPGDEYRSNATSPCIDAGTSISSVFSTDRDGLTRPVGAVWDIGPYERGSIEPTNTPTNTPTATLTSTPTNTLTVTPTSTLTNTPTVTPTSTATNTPTVTPTSTPTNTPTGTATTTPTVTPTSTPLSITLDGQVAVQARGTSGNPRWITELFRISTGGVEVYRAGTTDLVGVFSALTDATGRFSVELTGIGAGEYDIRVKGADTLSNKKLGVILPGGEIDFGTLLVGDCTGNDAVNGADTSYLIPSLLCCEADACYRPYADVNRSGCVNGADTSALIPNFLRAGPIITGPEGRVPSVETPGARVPAAGASLRLDPAEGAVEVGAVFTVDLLFDTGTGTADTVDAYLDFDPSSLEVVDSLGQLATSIELNTGVFSSAVLNGVNNATGRIDFSVSEFESPYLTGAFRAATIRFRAKAGSGSTVVELVREGARWSDVLLGGESLDPALGNAVFASGPVATR